MLAPTEIGVTATASVPFITSSMTPTPEREGDLTDSSHHSSTHAVDDEVTSIVRSSMPPPSVLTAAVATTIIADVTFASAPRVGTGQVPPSIFRDSTSTSEANQDITGPSHPVGTQLSTDLFFVSQDVDSKTLHQIYISKWNVINDSTLDDPDICHGVIDHLAPPALFSQLRRKKFEDRCAIQAGWLKERDAEIASLKAQLSLKEAESAEAIRLHSQVAIVEAARASEQNGLKERNMALEGQVVALEFEAATKDSELASSNTHIAKLTQDLSNLQLSCDELSIKASSLEFEKDKLVDQVSKLESTCSELRDKVSSYKLFKEHIEAVRDVQVKVLSDRFTELDANLMGMALHLDEEFYLRYLTTLAGRRWILIRGLKLVVMKCLQSPEYLASLGGAIGRAIYKGMHVGLAAGIDHGKAERDLTVIAAYDPSVEANYMFVVSALRTVNFPILAQLESYKDASIADLMGLLHLEGPAA
ncbi:hypothetical protein Tco_1077732 [Tanacetum coccineum]